MNFNLWNLVIFQNWIWSRVAAEKVRIKMLDSVLVTDSHVAVTRTDFDVMSGLNKSDLIF